MCECEADGQAWNRVAEQGAGCHLCHSPQGVEGGGGCPKRPPGRRGALAPPRSCPSVLPSQLVWLWATGPRVSLAEPRALQPALGIPVGVPWGSCVLRPTADPPLPPPLPRPSPPAPHTLLLADPVMRAALAPSGGSSPWEMLRVPETQKAPEDRERLSRERPRFEPWPLTVRPPGESVTCVHVFHL